MKVNFNDINTYPLVENVPCFVAYTEKGTGIQRITIASYVVVRTPEKKFTRWVDFRGFVVKGKVTHYAVVDMPTEV